MIHPDTELRRVNDIIGLGVFATRSIPRGTIVWVLDDLDHRLTPDRVRRLRPQYGELLERFSYFNGAGERVLCWDLARWTNHSCEANALSSGWDFDIAIRDIGAGEEVTNDYGCLNLEQNFVCKCRSPSCRGTVRPEDFELLADAWDKGVREAFLCAARVEQPLWKWVRPRQAVMKALRDPERVPSIRRHRFPAAAELRSSARARRI